MESTSNEQSDTPVTASQKQPRSLTTYTRVWVVLGTYILFCIAARSYSSRETGFAIDVLSPCLLATSIAYLIGDWLYIKLNGSQRPTSPDETPWSSRHIFNSFLSNTAATFVSQGSLSLSDLITGVILHQVCIFLQSVPDNALGAPSTSHRSRLMHTITYLAIAFVAYMFAPAFLESTLFYFIRVYLRATFNTTVDALIYLLTSPASRRNRWTSLLLLLPSVSIVTFLLFRSQFMRPN